MRINGLTHCKRGNIIIGLQAGSIEGKKKKKTKKSVLFSFGVCIPPETSGGFTASIRSTWPQCAKFNCRAKHLHHYIFFTRVIFISEEISKYVYLFRVKLSSALNEHVWLRSVTFKAYKQSILYRQRKTVNSTASWFDQTPAVLRTPLDGVIFIWNYFSPEVKRENISARAVGRLTRILPINKSHRIWCAIARVNRS